MVTKRISQKPSGKAADVFANLLSGKIKTISVQVVTIVLTKGGKARVRKGKSEEWLVVPASTKRH